MRDSAARIRQKTVADLMRYRNAPPAQVERRLRRLEGEWNLARAAGAGAVAFALAGFALGAFNRRFLLMPAAVCGFLLEHALRGTSTPARLLRRLGFRRPHEIEAERLVLKRMAR